MKPIIAVLIACLISLNLSAERSDRFNDYESMTGQVIRLYNVVSMVEHQGYFAYTMQEGKLKVVKNHDLYKQIEIAEVKVKGVIQNKKERYLHIKALSKDIYLILDKGFDYIHNAISVTYWEEYLSSLSDTHKFISSSSVLLKGTMIPNNGDEIKFYPVDWREITIPKVIRGEVYLACIINNSDSETTYISADQLEHNRKDFLFEIPHNERREAPSVNITRQQLDYINPAIIDKSNVFEAYVRNHPNSRKLLKEYGINLNSNDNNLKICIFGAERPSPDEETLYQGFILETEVILPESCIDFRSQTHKSYLLKRGNEGIKTRKEVARSFNLITSRNYRDSLSTAHLKQK